MVQCNVFAKCKVYRVVNQSECVEFPKRVVVAAMPVLFRELFLRASRCAAPMPKAEPLFCAVRRSGVCRGCQKSELSERWSREHSEDAMINWKR